MNKLTVFAQRMSAALLRLLLLVVGGIFVIGAVVVASLVATAALAFSWLHGYRPALRRARRAHPRGEVVDVQARELPD